MLGPLQHRLGQGTNLVIGPVEARSDQVVHRRIDITNRFTRRPSDPHLVTECRRWPTMTPWLHDEGDIPNSQQWDTARKVCGSGGVCPSR